MPIRHRVRVSLNDDMLVEILTRLPLKSFSRSKCVSKSWQSLVEDDYTRNKLPLIVSGVFQRSSTSPLKGGPTFISTSTDDATCFRTANLESFPFKSNSTLIDCCNGLLLFYSSRLPSFYVYNPITEKYITLPKPSKETQLSILAFDPYYSRHFKVVNFTGWHNQSADVEMFDSKSGNWGEHRLHWGLDTNSLSTMMRYMDGVLYIVAQSEQVVAVDLDCMSCSLIKLPEGAKRECCIGKMGGRLHYGVNGGNQLRVWMWKGEDEDEGEWELKYCVSFDSRMDQFRVLALNPERDLVYLWVKGELVAYDVGNERVEEVWEVGKDEKGYLVQVSVFPFSRYMEDCLAR